jgi:membrane protein implicated in regulation of membrane protease activity
VSLLAIAWTIVAFLVGALVVVLCVVMANLFRVITSTRDLIDGVTKQTVPMLAEVGTTVTLVNQEIGRVDGILATAETTTTAIGNVVTVVSSTVTSPLVRLSAFAWGLRRAVRKAAEEDEETAGRRRRGRRRR